MTKTNIEWTDRVWNPVRGCSKVSTGCRNCYAIRTAHRFDQPGKPYDGLTVLNSAGGKDHVDWSGVVTCHPEKLGEPLSWKKPSRIFVNSMSDLFHEEVPDDFIQLVFAVMGMCPRHTFQILTKRPQRMLEFLKKTKLVIFPKQFRIALPLPNVWLGVSCENQMTADERIPLLLETPAAIRFVSAEPLLGPIDFSAIAALRPASGWWIIAGGESGPDARPCHPDCIRSIRDQCKDANIPFFFKQWGEWFPRDQWEHNPDLILPDDDYAYNGTGKDIHRFPCDEGIEVMHRVGKKLSGRTLDGIEHNAYPK